MAIKPEFEQVKYGDDIDAIKWNSNFKEILDYVEDISEELTLKVNTINSQLSSNVLSSLQSVYPVGSFYIGETETCPMANLFGTWEKIQDGLVLQNSDSEHEIGTTIEAGLPDITGDVTTMNSRFSSGGSGAFAGSDGSSTGSAGAYKGTDYGGNATLRFNASKSNPIYGKSNTVQPPAYVVNIWKRTA